MGHPYISDMRRHVEELVPLGLDGIEVFHGSHSRQQGENLKEIAARHNLICTGGSDFHGREDRNSRIGSQKVPAVFLDAIRARVQSIRGQM
jgi:predicted metal-dependent phosphoesterase TrpH